MTEIIGPIKETGADVVPSPSPTSPGFHPGLEGRIHHTGLSKRLAGVLWVVRDA